MKPKEPRFTPLLKYKSFIEDTMRQEMLNEAEKLALEEKRIFALEEIWSQAVEELKERQTRKGDPNEILMYHTYLNHLSLDIDSQRKRVIEAMERFNEKREYLIEATKERKIVEKVVEKGKKGMLDDANREEKKVMNETAQNRYLRDNC
ncbi:MAG: flagellar export protein FliJ [Nitrospirae bacterium RIFCSPLOW2_12_42_9]|nr:MAG: flagellar export protein FliJ [Nitrospirae bacterium GWA2_42_11]OGW53756.1 MAG: flagellar export protein FliJ [Nitrospirae bacterium RIFCSPLOWO2_02_42_7]OGW60143.1 MAG: flagellar export protein FliJ [Nitrospirae bacterium RIFCSPHIGHO2_02_FULL_42_12]OGW63137.1 MAG: flagellar export protein FliJ [Nitrospirae bacterium RIFCSPLOW2_12_42_9]HAS16908.1 flagellar export protein FliJ [Nitrospiraceae bacterium]